MDWRLQTGPEYQIIAEGLDVVSSLFPFYSDFLEAFKTVEEEIRAKHERALIRKAENEVRSSDDEEKAVTKEIVYERQSKDNNDQGDASHAVDKWETVENNQGESISRDHEAEKATVNQFSNGKAEKFKSGLRLDVQPNKKQLSIGCATNTNGEGISRVESADHEYEEKNYTAAQERDGAEHEGNRVISSNIRSGHTGIKRDTSESEKCVGDEACLGEVTTRNSTAESCHDLYKDDDGENNPRSGRHEIEMNTLGNTDDEEEENVSDSDDESSVSEKLHWSFLYNFRTMLYSVTGKTLGRARCWNAKVLRHQPTNFIALRNKVDLYLKLSLTWGDDFVSSALETLEQLEEVAKDRKEMLIAKAEVAAIRERIASSADDLFENSIPLYEAVLQEVDHLPESTFSDSTFRDMVALWKRDLVEVYLELIKATRTVLERHGHTQSTVFSRVKDILQSVADDETVTKTIRAQASFELGNAFISYLANATKEEKDQQFHEEISIDACFRQARLLDPDNTDILLRAARQQRISAKTLDELKEVIELLSECVNKLSSEKGEQKDVALHHLGLAYRTLWWKTGSHITPPMRVYFRSSGLRDATGFSPPIGCRVIKPPNTKIESVLVPRPYKNPPKHIFQRDLNPVAREEDTNLLEARECFIQADDLTQEGSGCLYPIEVARTYISTGDTKKVREYLEKAHQRKGIGQNGVYLYEQMGLFEESTLTDDWNATAYDIRMEKIKSIYREAIRYDTRGSRSAITAFYRLLDILYGQIQTKEVDLVVQTEYFLLYMTVQQTEKPNDLVKTMTDDDIKTGFMWRLIEMFHQRNHPHDAAAAFTYLSIIAAAKKLPVDAKDVSLTIPERQKLLLESTERVAPETTHSRYIPQVYQWLCYLDDFGKENRSVYNSPFGIVVDMKSSAELKAVSSVLRKQLQLKSFEIIRASTLPDELSKDDLERVLNTLEKCASVIVITKIGSDQVQKMSSIVAAFCSGSSCNRRRICQAVFAEVEGSELLSDVPTWYIDKKSAPCGENKGNEVNQACRLLRTLFGRHI